MYPFSFAEIYQLKEKFIDNIFSDELPNQSFQKLDVLQFFKKLLFGGFPPVLGFNDLGDVKRWIRSYLQTIMQRDLKNLANIEAIYEMPRLFKLLATRNSMLLNIADLSRTLGMINVTVGRYLYLLQILFFINLLPAWFSNRGKRLIKSPKVHLSLTP